MFQVGFDVGYAQGFRNGFVLGRYQGLKVAHQQIDNQRLSESSATMDLMLTKPTRGQCQLCVDQQLINKDIPEITDIQAAHAAGVEAALSQRYHHLDTFVVADV